MSEAPKTPKPIKYLVCVNDSTHSRVALKFACARARKRGSKLELFHVVEPVEFAGIASVADKIRDENREKGEALIKALTEEICSEYDLTVSAVLEEGDVEEGIVKQVENDPDIHMLVLGASPDSSGRHAHITGLVRELGDRLLVPLVIIPGNLTDAEIDRLS